MSASRGPGLIVDGVVIAKAPVAEVYALLTEDERALARTLMTDHGCILHNGPDSGPCRACMRRVLLVRAWLRERTGAPR